MGPRGKPGRSPGCRCPASCSSQPAEEMPGSEGGGKIFFLAREGCCAPPALGTRWAFHISPLPWQPRIGNWEGATGQGTGGSGRAAAAGIIRQKLIRKENFTAVRANIDFVFVCFCGAWEMADLDINWGCFGLIQTSIYTSPGNRRVQQQN